MEYLMKHILSCTKRSILLVLIAVILLGVYAYMLTRPVSYGMDYHTRTEYGGVEYEGTLRFYTGGTMVNRNSNFDSELESYYHCKDGYVFFLTAITDEAYEKEVAYINENFEEAVNSPFYAAKANTLRIVNQGPDGYAMVYTCTPAILFAAVGGAVELVLIVLTCLSLGLGKKKK